MPLWDCAICGAKADADQRENETRFSCARCGKYRGAPGWRQVDIGSEHQIKLSKWVREQNDFGEIPLITPEISSRVAALATPRLRDRADRALGLVVKDIGGLGISRSLMPFATDTAFQGATFSKDHREAETLLRVLIEEGYLEGYANSINHVVDTFALTAKGMFAAEEHHLRSPASRQGFVAMSFSDDLKDAWVKGFDPAIRAAGYRPMRIDATDYAGGVMDQIITEIRQSRFVVADCTQQRNGVYFEAGFATGMGLLVIPTCRSDDMKNRHFDIQHLNTLEWNTPEELGTRLSKRIIAILGPGPDLPLP
jgi:hypothetical protein